MPVFELQGPDGAVYEIEAPDEQAAVSAFQSLSQPQQQGAPTSGMTDVLTQGATFGFGDEVGAAGAATGGFLRSVTDDIMSGSLPSLGDASTAAGQSYDRRLGELRGSVEQARKEHPILATGTEILGGLGAAGTLAKGGATLLNAAKPTMASMIGRGAAEGAAYGAVHGFGTGEGLEDRAGRAASSAGLGALTGGAVGALGARMARPKQTAPTVEQLKAQGRAAYDAAEQAGLVISQPTMSKTVSNISSAAKMAGIDKTIHPRATAALARLDDAANSQPTLKDMDLLRRVLKGAAASPEADERRIAKIMIDRLDDSLANLTKADVVAGDPGAASNAIMKARGIWSRMRKAELIEDAVERATRRAASTGSGGNADNAIRQNIRSLLENKKTARTWSKEERELMERVIRGGPIQNLARLVGKLSPQGNGLMAALGLGATVANPLMAAAPVAGMAAKKFADQATPRNVDALLNAVRAGQVASPQQLSGPQRALLEGLLFSGAQQGSNVIP